VNVCANIAGQGFFPDHGFTGKAAEQASPYGVVDVVGACTSLVRISAVVRVVDDSAAPLPMKNPATPSAMVTARVAAPLQGCTATARALGAKLLRLAYALLQLVSQLAGEMRRLGHLRSRGERFLPG
jgi:hypothetical protein